MDGITVLPSTMDSSADKAGGPQCLEACVRAACLAAPMMLRRGDVKGLRRSERLCRGVDIVEACMRAACLAAPIMLRRGDVKGLRGLGTLCAGVDVVACCEVFTMRSVTTASSLGGRCSVLHGNAVSFFGRPIQVCVSGATSYESQCVLGVEGLTDHVFWAVR